MALRAHVRVPQRFQHTNEEGDVATPHVTRHPEYYFEDGNLVLLVENTLFRVFRSTFTRHSSVFRDMFSLPAPVGRLAEGTDDSTPLQLPGISARDFKRLLWVLYPSDYATPTPRTAEEWTSVLSLATRWDFPSVRALAITHLCADASLSPVDRILLASAYDIPDAPHCGGGRAGPEGGWLLGAYTALCTRAEPLTVAEAARLGVDTVARVAQLREALRGRNPSTRFGGYCAPTLSTAAREAATTQAQAQVQRLRGGGRVDSRQPPLKNQALSARKNPTGIPGTARLVAQTFGITVVP